MKKEVYTMEQWEKDGSISLEIGQEVANEVILELKNCVPPAFLGGGIFQPGESYCLDKANTEASLYLTFTHDGEGENWIYRGLCLYGQTTPREGLKFFF